LGVSTTLLRNGKKLAVVDFVTGQIASILSAVIRKGDWGLEIRD
jgi:hypothetical protein